MPGILLLEAARQAATATVHRRAGERLTRTGPRVRPGPAAGCRSRSPSPARRPPPASR
ncbi:hypothetical protein ACLQ2N_35335 [Streptomyces sp. DT224]|uniref:hypothetical protein n=1 Tax=Streptomyces sp. DT224 TaxID=3393426 RepID=UPI003CEFA001